MFAVRGSGWLDHQRSPRTGSGQGDQQTNPDKTMQTNEARPTGAAVRVALDAFCIMHEVHNGGHHLVVRHAGHVVDVWPKLCKWADRDGARGQGWQSLARRIGVDG